MCDESGEVTTQPAKMAEILHKHWSGDFARKDIDETVLRGWLEDVFPEGGRGQAVIGLPPRESPEWTLQEKDVEEAVNQTSDTSPGPDQIPYLAWRRLGRLGNKILFEAAVSLQSPDHHRYYAKHRKDLMEIMILTRGCFAACRKNQLASDATRPLCIVNKENRVIAAAMRLRLEPILNKWVTLMQQGFLKGRSMLKNMVDIDYEAMTISLRRPQGALILFDFQAAFPSLAHDELSA